VTEKREYPRIRDQYRERSIPKHISVRVTWADGESPHEFCGDNWCKGECGLAALVILADPHDGQERFWKASGSQVAVGSVMQYFHVPWSGAKVEVPEQHRAHFRRLMWW
jgi:hypothetical protein